MTHSEPLHIAAVAAVVSAPSAAVWIAPIVSGQFAEFITSLALVVGLYTIVQCIKYNAPVVWSALVVSSVLYIGADVYMATYYTHNADISPRDLTIYVLFVANWAYVLGRVRIFNVLAALYRVWGKMSIDERKEWLKHHGAEL